MTFDDGPHPRKTKPILELLARYGAKATFFVVGDNAERFPDLLRETAERGHEIGNHTFSHTSKHGGITDLMLDIARCEEAVYRACGVRTRLFRPPGGVKEGCAGEAMARMSYRYVMWTVDTRDWDKTPANGIIRTVLDGVKDGSIILFHDFTCDGCHTYEALERILPELKARGYEFVTVSELPV